MRVVSLFSGAGGLDLGFSHTGHEMLWANDIDKDAVNSYRNNIGNHILCESIENIRSKHIPECDIVIGGFPCQGFSVANMNRSAADSRNKLYRELVRVIKDKQPRYFLAENVKGLATMDKGQILKVILRDLSRAGYKVKHKILNAADFGVPQRRERIIFVGVRNDIKHNIEFPIASHADPLTKPNPPIRQWVTIGEALRGIPEPKDAPDLPNHTCSRYKLRFNGYIGHRLIDPDKPAPTITARGDSRGGVVVLHHPRNHRRMSARELATTQSFPLNFVFSGCLSSVYRQIGNAVPPLFSAALASMFK